MALALIEITEAEREVMVALWAHSPLRSSEIVEAVADDRAWHPKTVSTLIRRLVDKGAIGFKKSTGGYLYSALVSREDYRSREARRLVTELFDGKVTPLLASFANTQSLSKADLAALRRLVTKLQK